jgi:CHAT domain-containing protein/tetratricopeptide (TPR) repeat protein
VRLLFERYRRLKPGLWSRVEKLHAAADAHANAGDYESARALSEQAVHLALRKVGPTDPGAAECCLHLARIQESAGDLTGAEPSYNAACGILNPTEGEATLLKAEVLLGYGSLYAKMRLGWRAILLLGHAKERFVELYGPDHQGVGQCQGMMAVSFETLGMEEEALVAYREASRILSAAWGPTHPSVTFNEWCRADLAFWRAMKGGDTAGVEQALADFRASLALFEATVGRDHPDVASRRARLGSCLVVNECFDEGASLLSDAIAILEAAGEQVSTYCRQLAKARVRLGDTAGALALLRRSISDDPVGHWVAHGSDRERMHSLELVRRNIGQYLDLVVEAGLDDPSVIEEACNLVLRRKALGAELLATQRRAVSRGDDPELTSLMTRLAELRAQVAESTLTGAEVTGQAFADIERLEWELASRVPEMDLDAGLLGITKDAIAALLPEDSVLVEFVRFTRYETIVADADALEDGFRDWYITFVIQSGEGGELRLVDLGAAPEIDRLIREFRGAVAREAGERAVDARRDIGRRDDHVAEFDGGKALRARLFDPFLPLIGNRTRVLIAPDGDVTRVPFEALPDGSSGYLIDTLDISYVGVGRDLMRLSARPYAVTPGAPLVVADPDYDLRRQAKAATSGTQPTAMIGDRDQLRHGLSRSGTNFGRLPGTREEGIAVAGLLRVDPLLGEAALEERLKAARSPVVLHIATHGFFLTETAHDRTAPDDVASTRLSAAAHNPLVRSGLALSGANAWLRGESPPGQMDDGILNGEDIVSMDLTATDLVVLSACESGLGDLIAGEGVMGLRRAFAVAGARTLVLSLWKVPDEQTRMLMTYFYAALSQGRGRSESLREAQRRVRAEYPAPYYWAAFICQGDPTPIPYFRASRSG